MSPKWVSTSVRGIGVAVITKRSAALPLSLSASRCATPKRCCSSTTVRPRSWNSTPDWNSACVPTTMVVAPEAIPSRIARRSAAFCLPVSSAMPSPDASASGFSVRKCCAASSSVGDISADCAPLSATAAIASRRRRSCRRRHRPAAAATCGWLLRDRGGYRRRRASARPSAQRAGRPRPAP